jgi:hypothetical protein
MFKSFLGFLKGDRFGVNHTDNRQLGFQHPPSTDITNYDASYNSNDHVIFNAYLKDGSIHQVKLVDAEDYIEQNRDNIARKIPKFRRTRLG